MAMKKIKPQYGKVTASVVNNQESSEVSSVAPNEVITTNNADEEKRTDFREKSAEPEKNEPLATKEKVVFRLTSDPNPFLQTKEIFGKARLTKIGYRMRADYVEILDIIKKIKKGGYTLEAVLDDALTYYFENSEDGKEALKKAEIFYS